MNHKVPVVVMYPWEANPTVFLCDTDEEAEALLRKLYKEEYRIEIEENGREPGLDMDSYIADDNRYAWIAINYNDLSGDFEDITEWSIGHIYDVPEEK